jgi:hypothetical protein
MLNAMQRHHEVVAGAMLFAAKPQSLRRPAVVAQQERMQSENVELLALMQSS